MKNIRKLNNMLFDAAPPLGFIIIAGAIVVVPIVMLLIFVASWLIRKARGGNKKTSA